ncbi:multidrug ABC transporter permease [Virgisporangium aliadipatigenens]|uniref:Multidrug ABC transporter permease n=1 Tax=Virgisporangium aliadipatigenens TaxID=741659 RepID=A0A8J3YRT3_9ACTN|nr:ABC transporter ATP-binding protein [Virgisporangium aliadipatigenens]GIJ50296.1 multidrug ABC transporter permease [Virgisporangium aliadipatigenens]
MRQQRLGPRRAVSHSLAAAGMRWRAAPVGSVVELLITLLTGATPVLTAWLLKLLLDDLTSGRASRERVLALAAALGATGVVGLVLPHVTRYLDAEITRRVTRLVRQRLFTAVNRLTGIGRLEDPRFHDRLQLAQQTGHMGPSELSGGLMRMAAGLVAVGGFATSLLLLHPLVALLVVAAAGPGLWAELRLSRARAATFLRMEQRERRERFYTHLVTGVEAAKEVRLFGLGGFFTGRMLAELDAANAEHRGLDRRQLRAQSLVGLLGAAVAGLAIWSAVAAAFDGRITAGGVALVLAAIPGVQGGLGSLVGQAGRMHQALLFFDHYRVATGQPPDLPLAGSPVPVAALSEGIVFHDVWFRYGDNHPWVLRGVDLTLPAGRSVGLVGLNGAGKSTMVKLLCRFYDPTKGRITWDGVDLRDLDPAALRARLGAVFQDHTAYDLTATENIGVADLPALSDPARIAAAARDAGLHDAIAALPRGYDTLLSRIFFDADDLAADGDPDTGAGVVLSGGQWQRMAVARGFLRADRDLLILDEPSNGLDAEAEHDLHVRLMRMREGRSSLLISHRLSAVRSADVIVVLAEGRVAEEGDHAALMAAGGGYARLFSLQARGYASPAAT